MSTWQLFAVAAAIYGARAVPPRICAVAAVLHALIAIGIRSGWLG